jgi:hypothetical protein
MVRISYSTRLWNIVHKCSTTMFGNNLFFFSKTYETFKIYWCSNKNRCPKKIKNLKNKLWRWLRQPRRWRVEGNVLEGESTEVVARARRRRLAWALAAARALQGGGGGTGQPELQWRRGALDWGGGNMFLEFEGYCPGFSINIEKTKSFTTQFKKPKVHQDRKVKSSTL